MALAQADLATLRGLIDAGGFSTASDAAVATALNAPDAALPKAPRDFDAADAWDVVLEAQVWPTMGALAAGTIEIGADAATKAQVRAVCVIFETLMRERRRVYMTNPATAASIEDGCNLLLAVGVFSEVTHERVLALGRRAQSKCENAGLPRIMPGDVSAARALT